MPRNVTKAQVNIATKPYVKERFKKLCKARETTQEAAFTAWVNDEYKRMAGVKR